MTELPTIDEIAAGAFLHDAGKLLQRAMGSSQGLPESVRNLESTLLPVFEGRYSHKHVLFTEEAFQALERKGTQFPIGIRREIAREAAVWHHKPESGPAWAQIVAVADRISAGMDRKAKDVAAEREDDPRGWDAFRKVPLRSVFDAVSLGSAGKRPETWLAPVEMTPEALFASHDKRSQELPTLYAQTAERFGTELERLCRSHHGLPTALFHEGLIALGERFWWAVPSSTVDEPDVSLFDHSLSVAAFATCLFAHHAARDELDDRIAITDTRRPKFRLLRIDLSGIQATLFRLAAQGTRGVNRILRGRSFLMGMLVDAAALAIRREFGLPPYVVLMRAGGQALLLLPELDDLESRIAQLQERVDRWMLSRYSGDLAMVLALGAPQAANAFGRGRPLEATFEDLRLATEAAKLRPLAAALRCGPVLVGVDYDEDAQGACPACGARPRRRAGSDDVLRCDACHAEHEIGRDLTRLAACVWLDGTSQDPTFAPFDGPRLRLVREGEDFDPRGNIVSAWRLRGVDRNWPFADRYLANHVPRLSAELVDDPRLGGIEDRADEIGDALTMAELGALARDRESRRGRPLLGVLKADVDRLGQVFGFGLGEHRTIGRLIALSRQMDAFFTGWLPHRLEQRHPLTYTVFAGGDDLVLIAPWSGVIDLAVDLRSRFREYVGRNPDLTISAGIEFVDTREPLTRSADRAEAQLERAKGRGGAPRDSGARDRLGVLDAILCWEDEAAGVPWLVANTTWLNGRLAGASLSTAWLYKLLSFLRDKDLADREGDLRAASWRARYRYHLARARSSEADTVRFHQLMGLDAEGRRGKGERPSAQAITLALWRNR